jgi:alanyl-tRNA synthetase
MTAKELRRSFIDFFAKKHGHAEISSASLIPENDPTVLFTTAGMHPLVPFLMGEKHPAGTRLVDVQKCVRTDDIDEVGDPTHCTFFEMLGNWSLGDYFKKDAIAWSYEYLTSPIADGGLGLDPDRLMVSCFAGDKDAPRDDEAAKVWESLGFKRYDNAVPTDKKQIYFYEKKKNWWGPAGHIGPCGPDTEMFYDLNPELPGGAHKPGASEELKKKYILTDRPESCHANCECGRYVEIWNDVFMQYNKMPDGTFQPLKQQNVDTGMGFERVLAIIQGKPTHYETELFLPVMEMIAELASGAARHLKSGQHQKSTFEVGATSEVEMSTAPASADFTFSSRIIADHIRAAVFIMGDPWGVTPSNLDQGYILRRLIRRAIRHGRKIGITESFITKLAEKFVEMYSDVYPEVLSKKEHIITQLKLEEEKFGKTLDTGLREMKKTWAAEKAESAMPVTEGDKAFYIYETYGFPIELIEEELQKNGYKIETKIFRASFEDAMKKHQETSRAGSEMKFAGGLADHSDEVRKLHTATHLLHKALKMVLGEGVNQKGSNITAERLRFDFNHPQKVTPEQLKKVEEIVNEQIRLALPISYEITTVDAAKAKGAVGLFENKYGDQIKVYSMGDFSKEICGGPHADNTADLKSFKIIKEEASSAGVRRIKAVIGK